MSEAKELDYHRGYPGETLPFEELLEHALVARSPGKPSTACDWADRFAEQALRRIAQELVVTRQQLREANEKIEDLELRCNYDREEE